MSSFVSVNWMSLSCGQNKTLEDVILSSGKHWVNHFTIFWLFIDQTINLIQLSLNWVSLWFGRLSWTKQNKTRQWNKLTVREDFSRYTTHLFIPLLKLACLKCFSADIIIDNISDVSTQAWQIQDAVSSHVRHELHGEERRGVTIQNGAGEETEEQKKEEGTEDGHNTAGRETRPGAGRDGCWWGLQPGSVLRVLHWGGRVR